jgi:hypothetical protein
MKLHDPTLLRTRCYVDGAWMAAADGATGVTYLNLYRDTEPVAVVQGDAAARAMFPWNF